MKSFKVIAALMALFIVFIGGCDRSQNARDSLAVQRQQAQYGIGQPIPTYDWSIERDLLIQLYNIRNQRVATHSIWRSNSGVIEGDCASIGYGIPYDTSLTNPLQISYRRSGGGVGVVGQAEPNGVFASTNTAATWVLCADTTGSLSPVYIEAKVTVFPWPMEVDYKTNSAVKAGEASVTIKLDPKGK